MKSFISESYKYDHWCNWIILILVFSFLILFSLHGEHYVNCMSVFPDEIMDLQCSAFHSVLADEQGTASENRKYKQSFPSLRINIPSIFGDYTDKISLLIEFVPIQDLKDKLFTLQRYKS
jgi:hypothetical protein